jgi:hypothetical protein
MTFDPRQWLQRFEEAGGGYALSPGGKLVFLTGNVDGLSLALLFRQIVCQPLRLAAVKAAIAEGEPV